MIRRIEEMIPDMISWIVSIQYQNYCSYQMQFRSSSRTAIIFGNIDWTLGSLMIYLELITVLRYDFWIFLISNQMNAHKIVVLYYSSSFRYHTIIWRRPSWVLFRWESETQHVEKFSKRLFLRSKLLSYHCNIQVSEEDVILDIQTKFSWRSVMKMSRSEMTIGTYDSYDDNSVRGRQMS